VQVEPAGPGEPAANGGERTAREQPPAGREPA
jgi:hypothetical protein